MIAGIETEYGIMVEDGPLLDPAEASQLFFNLWRPARLTSWEFATEQPSQDARGWLDLGTPLAPPEASPEPAAPARKASNDGAPAPTIALVDRSNFNSMLPNGARFYIDHAHPEYSTPECLSVRDLVAADAAGQWFLADVARQVSERSPSGHRFALYRNNTDFHGRSYGCHENYLMSAETYTALFGNRQHLLFTFLIPFLVTRQIFCGAGKTGAENGGAPVDYQISQRADFVETVVGLQTVWRRPIINTRDEPHADAVAQRRLHVIVGDANMSEPTTRLKVGVTRLVLEMLEAGRTGANLAFADPVAAIKAVSRDLTCKKPVIVLEGHNRPVSALDIQRRYLDEARQFLDEFGATAEQQETWTMWQATLAALENDPSSLARQLDWVIKHELLQSQISKRGLGWDSPVIKEMDVKYHGVNPDRSLFQLLVRNNLADRFVTDEEIRKRLSYPPSDTRAAFRCALMKALEPILMAVNWDCVTVLDAPNTQLLRLRLTDPARNADDFVKAVVLLGDPLAAAVQCCTVERFLLGKTKE